jgi:hypothetical protein
MPYGVNHPLAAEEARRRAQLAQQALPPSPVQMGLPPRSYPGSSMPMDPGEYRAQHPTGGMDSAPGRPGLYGSSAAAGQQGLRQGNPYLSQQNPVSQAHFDGLARNELMAAQKPLSEELAVRFGAPLREMPFAKGKSSELLATQMRPGPQMPGLSMPPAVSPVQQPMGVAATGPEPATRTVRVAGSEAGELPPGALNQTQRFAQAAGLPGRSFTATEPAPHFLNPNAPERPLYAQTKLAGPTGIPGVHPMPRPAVATPQPPQVGLAQAPGGGAAAFQGPLDGGGPPSRSARFLQSAIAGINAHYGNDPAWRSHKVQDIASAQAKAAEMDLEDQKLGLARDELAQNKPLIDAQVGQHRATAERTTQETSKFSGLDLGQITALQDPNTPPEAKNKILEESKARQAFQGRTIAHGGFGISPYVPEPPQNAFEAKMVLGHYLPGFNMGDPAQGGTVLDTLTRAQAGRPDILGHPVAGRALGMGMTPVFGQKEMDYQAQPSVFDEPANTLAQRAFLGRRGQPQAPARPQVQMAGPPPIAPAAPPAGANPWAGPHYNPATASRRPDPLIAMGTYLANAPWWNWAAR